MHNSEKRPKWHAVIRTLAVFALIAMVGLAAIRILRLEQSAFAVSLQSGFFYLFLPAYAVLVIAALIRARWLAIVATALIACHLSWMAPDLLASKPLVASDGPTFRVFTHNIKFDNESPEDLGADIKKADADFVFLEELTWSGWQTVTASGALDSYPYHQINEAGTDGLGLWSKHPLKESALMQSPGFPYIRALTTVDGREVALYTVHTRAPVNGDVSYWHGDLARLRERMSAETTAVVAAGDFNANSQHRPFRDLTAAGFDDAAAATGRGYLRTWPLDILGGNYIGGYVALDHVLTSDELQARSFVDMSGGGSDHRAIYADVQFLDQR